MKLSMMVMNLGALMFLLTVNEAFAAQPVPDLRGTWTGRSVCHVNEKGFVSSHIKLKLVVEEQVDTEFKGYMIKNPGLNQAMEKFNGAINIEEQYFFIRTPSRGSSLGRILTRNIIKLFLGDKARDSVVLFKLKRVK